MKRLMRASGSICASFHSPASCGEMRPPGVTAVASQITSAAPPTAREPRWTRCQSLAIPSSEEYWHIGETPMRFRNVTSLIRSSLNRWGVVMGFAHGFGAGGSSAPIGLSFFSFGPTVSWTYAKGALSP